MRRTEDIWLEGQELQQCFNGNDETELTASNMRELEELWDSLCPEFGCKSDSVDYVERVMS